MGTTTVDPGPGADLGAAAKQLLDIAEELGLEPRVVQITHDPHQVFVVPDEVAEKYDFAQKSSAPPKRRRRAAASDEAPEAGEEEGKGDA